MSIDNYLSWLENKADIAQTRMSTKSELNGWFFTGLGLIVLGLTFGLSTAGVAGILAIAVPTTAFGLSQIIKSSSRMMRSRFSV